MTIKSSKLKNILKSFVLAPLFILTTVGSATAAPYQPVRYDPPRYFNPFKVVDTHEILPATVEDVSQIPEETPVIVDPEPFSKDYNINQCTYHAAHKTREHTGSSVFFWNGDNGRNAVTFKSRCENSDGCTTGKTPVVGSVAYFDRMAIFPGHVAYVEEVFDDGTWTASHCNFGNGTCGYEGSRPFLERIDTNGITFLYPTGFEPPQMHTVEPKTCIDEMREDAAEDNHVPWDSCIYKEYTEGTDIPWEILSAIHLKENGRIHVGNPIISTSYAGAQGPCQFMPRTWRGYGLDGNDDGIKDVWNAEDCLAGSVNLLQANYEVKQSMYGAIWSYNHSDKYVKSIQSEARIMGWN